MSTTMKRIFTKAKQRSSSEDAAPAPDTPEAAASRGVRLFCESGGPNNSGDEVLHLPGIVEAAESSPGAAKEAASAIRKFLSTDNLNRPYVQYNGMMLVRILSDNPGPTFTRNLDTKFANTVKDLLRQSRDPSVHQIIRETLDSFDSDRASDGNLTPLREMWRKEKDKMAKTPRGNYANPYLQNQSVRASQQNYCARPHKNRGLPPTDELAGRLEEAKTSARLLLQVVQSTPPSEVLSNDLIKEFAERCQSASASIQGYINAQDPAPDDDTLLTLIETNELLSMAMSKHQRAILQARRALGSQSVSPSPPAAAEAKSQGDSQREANNPFGDDKETSSSLQAPLQPSLAPHPESAGRASPERPSATPYNAQHRPTPSYIHRQDSALMNGTMHGAANTPSTAEGEPPMETRASVTYRF